MTEAAERLHKQWKAIPGQRARARRLQAGLEAAWRTASFRAILCDYYTAQTYEDPKDPQRREMEEKASKELDDACETKCGDPETSLYAKILRGKLAMELGDDPELAKDILDEVLANFETGEGCVFSPESAWFYAQAKRLQLELTARESVKKFIAEATEWREPFRRRNPRAGSEFVRISEGYQAISLALARALIAQANKAVGEERAKLTAEARKVLDEMVKVPGAHQREAIEELRELQGPRGQPPDEGPAAIEHKNRGVAEVSWEPALGDFSVAAWEAAASVIGKAGKEPRHGAGTVIIDGGGGNDISGPFGGRGIGRRAAMLAAYGGTKQTQRAVAGALHWLMRHQAYDGSWSFDKYNAQCKDASCTGRGAAHADAGATGMALLCYLGAGQTHKTKGPYRRNIEQGLVWLVRHQGQDGNLAQNCVSPMYSHGIAAMALCEALGTERRPQRGVRCPGGDQLHHRRPEQDRPRLAL